jgi:nucleotide-binding universal stress UspA family protein
MDEGRKVLQRMKYLVGYNGSQAAKAALAVARKHARVFEAQILLVTSMEGGTREKPEDISDANLALEAARDMLRQEGIACEAHQLVRGLAPGEDLVKFAADNAVDMIFVGIEKRSRTQKMLLGSTAQFVILRASCPVLTVKP